MASWKLLPEDAATLLDALEYEQDVAAAEAAARDTELLRLHPRTRAEGGQGVMMPPPCFGVRKAGSARLRALLEADGMGRKAEPRAGRQVAVVIPRRGEKKGRRALGGELSAWVPGVGKPRVEGAEPKAFGAPSHYTVLRTDTDEGVLAEALETMDIAGTTAGRELRWWRLTMRRPRGW